jgi:hypothetical protein
MWARLVKEQMREDDPNTFRPKQPTRGFRKETLDSEEYRKCGAAHQGLKLPAAALPMPASRHVPHAALVLLPCV